MKKPKNNIDPHEAPKGYIAVEYVQYKKEDGCVANHCAFSTNAQCGGDLKCNSGQREDKYDVAFVKCKHNTMVANNNPQFAWKCADCGYVYGKD